MGRRVSVGGWERRWNTCPSSIPSAPPHLLGLRAPRLGAAASAARAQHRRPRILAVQLSSIGERQRLYGQRAGLLALVWGAGEADSCPSQGPAQPAQLHRLPKQLAAGEPEGERERQKGQHDEGRSHHPLDACSRSFGVCVRGRRETTRHGWCVVPAAAAALQPVPQNTHSPRMATMVSWKRASEKQAWLKTARQACQSSSVAASERAVDRCPRLPACLSPNTRPAPTPCRRSGTARAERTAAGISTPATPAAWWVLERSRARAGKVREAGR